MIERFTGVRGAKDGIAAKEKTKKNSRKDAKAQR
jgi:hypothetical protein